MFFIPWLGIIDIPEKDFEGNFEAAYVHALRIFAIFFSFFHGLKRLDFLSGSSSGNLACFK